jgi:glycosyltransferase involved in cell wall biosynthesis
MKIAVWHNLPSGGGKRALHDHVRGLLGRGHHLEAWCPPTADLTYLPLSTLIPEHIVKMRPLQRPSSNLVARLINLYRLTAGKFKALDEHCQRCAEQINQGEFDLLFANSAMHYAVAPIARYIKIPTTLYLQEPYRYLYEASPVSAWAAPYLPKGGWHSVHHIRDWLFDFFAVQWLRVQVREEYLSAQACNLILVNSLFSRESLLRAYGFNSRVCYLGVDTQRFVNQKLPRQNYVIGIGAIVPNKNIKFIIEALGFIPEPRPRLVWIGNAVDSSYLDEMNDLARARQVTFEIHQRASEEELVELLNQAAVMAYAPRLEPFGYAPLEANACGTPVIAVAEGGVRETVTDGLNGYLVDADPRAMAAAIERVLKNPLETRRIGEQAVEYIAENWSLEAATVRLESNMIEMLAYKRKQPVSIGFDKNAYWKNWTS